MQRSLRFRWPLLALVLACGKLWAVEPLPPLKLEVAYPNLKFDRPITALAPPSGDDRLYLVEQKGRILILPRDPSLNTTKVFLDITSRKPHIENAEGLLGFVFHPQYRSNGKFYICYTQHQPRRSILSEFRTLSTDSAQADIESERILLEVPQPYGNNNSGSLAFGPDGHLYMGLGDGGSENDPHDNGQNLRSLLGKILRLDVNRRTDNRAYGIPRDNPFANVGNGIRPEIWAFGFRNPWGISFDSATGDLYVADVGQNKWEEINIVLRGGNYGWNVYEGFHLFKPPVSRAVGSIFPIMEYPHSIQFADQATFPHSPGLCIAGGHVYRGNRLPNHQGVYFYADFATGTLWGLRYMNGTITHLDEICDVDASIDSSLNISGFGTTQDDEIVITSFDGNIYKFQKDTEHQAAK